MAEGQQVRYAELTCTPYTSVLRGIPIEAYTEAIEDARVAAERDFGLVLRWIYDIPGESGLPAADATLEYALDHRADALVGFGLGGPEIGVPRPQFQPHFDAARAAGLHSVPHAGETTGPETIWDALRAARRRADRPRHLGRPGPGAAGAPGRAPGSRWRSARRPTSRPAPSPRSRSTRCAAFVDAGVTVTINSDDPPMFGTTLNQEYAVAADLLDLDEAGLADLARGRRPRVVRAGRRAHPGARGDRPLLTLSLPWKTISFHGRD